MNADKKINASTEVYGLFGYPVAHSLSPLIHNALFQKLGMNAVYLAFPVEPKNLGLAFEAIRSLHLKGVNLTIPFKEEALDFVDEIPEDLDRCVGAINTVVNKNGRLFGYNTDEHGFLLALGEELKFNPAGKTILVLGAGGAARGVTFALGRANAARILLYNRTHERAEGLSEHLSDYFPETDIQALSSPDAVRQEKVDLVVNTTSCGMKAEDPLPMNLELLSGKAGIYDLIYSPTETKILGFARRLGLPCANGLGMLAAQAAYSFELWTGRKDGVREGMLEILKKCHL